MTSVIELLLETLAGLSKRELEYFKQIIWSQSYLYKPYLENPWMLLMMADMQDTVFIMVQTFGQQFVKKTKDILFQMNRRDLVKRLSDSSSGPKSKTVKTKSYSNQKTGSKHVSHTFISYVISFSSSYI